MVQLDSKLTFLGNVLYLSAGCVRRMAICTCLRGARTLTSRDDCSLDSHVDQVVGFELMIATLPAWRWRPSEGAAGRDRVQFRMAEHDPSLVPTRTICRRPRPAGPGVTARYK